jgi:hypothetical protein
MAQPRVSCLQQVNDRSYSMGITRRAKSGTAAFRLWTPFRAARVNGRSGAKNEPALAGVGSFHDHYVPRNTTRVPPVRSNPYFYSLARTQREHGFRHSVDHAQKGAGRTLRHELAVFPVTYLRDRYADPARKLGL